MFDNLCYEIANMVSEFIMHIIQATSSRNLNLSSTAVRAGLL